MSGEGYVPLATSGGAGDYTFGSIPSGYDARILRGQGQSGEGVFNQQVGLRCNADTGSNYRSYEYLIPDYVPVDHTVSAGSDTSGKLVYCGGTYLGDWPSFFETTIVGYDDTDRYTTWRTVMGSSGGNGGYGGAGFNGGLWQSTVAVTSITTVLGNWTAAYTNLTLYGRKG